MTWQRQGRSFLVIGVAQWLVDWLCMVLLSHVGWTVGIANITGRVSGALLGFWLNGRVTFAREDLTIGWRHLARYVLVWLSNAALSTYVMTLIDANFGLHWTWIVKPLFDGVLAGCTFLLSRHWIYR